MAVDRDDPNAGSVVPLLDVFYQGQMLWFDAGDEEGKDVFRIDKGGFQIQLTGDV